jgi:uncharacterized protein
MSGTGATETQNIAVIKRGYEAFGKGDIETLKTLFAPNAVWLSIGAGVLPGNYRGLQAILQFFGQLAHETHGTVRTELQTVAASGDHVFALHRNTGERKGNSVDTKSVLVFKVEKGVVTEVAEFPFDHPAEIRFWS